MKGYVLLDALTGLCIFSFGFAIYYGLIESAEQQRIDAQHYLEAANLAQNKMELLVHASRTETLIPEYCLPGQVISGKEGKYDWEVWSRWESPPSLLSVEVRIHWAQEDVMKEYSLESLFYVER